MLEPQPSALGDWLVEHSGLPRWERVTYRTTGVLDGWAGERGILPVTLELPKATHDAAVVRYAPMLADLLRGAI